MEGGYTEIGDGPSKLTPTIKNTIIALGITCVLSLIAVSVLLPMLLAANHRSLFTGCVHPEDDAVNTVDMVHEVQKRFMDNWFGSDTDSFVLVIGGTVEERVGTDTEIPFRQESHMLWLSGVLDEDCAIAIHTSTQESTLFIPRRDDQYATWNGFIRTPEQWKAQYGPDHVVYMDELKDTLEAAAPTELLMLDRPSQTFDGIANFTVDRARLGDAMSEARTLKTPLEINLMRYAVEAGAVMHNLVMENIKPGVYENEVEGLFRSYSFACGMRFQAYPPIVGAGTHGAILHYNDNDAIMNDGDILLIDAGNEYKGYAVDITRTYPINGEFTPEQRMIYDIVLEANDACQKKAKDGASWNEIGYLSREIIVAGLLDNGFLKGIDMDDTAQVTDVSRIFYPHGLGHLQGVDVHDTDIPTPGAYGSDDTLYNGMIITVEPGIYFNEAHIEPYVADSGHPLNQYLVAERIRSFYGFGGVRIEDDVLVTASGVDNFSQGSPRTVDAVEDLLGRKSN